MQHIQSMDKLRAVAKPMPRKWTDAMRGLGKHVWKNVSIEEYIKQLRNEWKYD